MRILQAVHAFYPEYPGGTQTQTLLLCKELQSLGHDVSVFYRIVDRDLPDYTVLEGTFQDLPTIKMVNNYTSRPASLIATVDHRVETPFESTLDKLKPDLVHFQHLGSGLSTSLLPLVKARGLPAVLTLHDYWYMCYRSQLMKVDGRRCKGPEGGNNCLDCYLQQAPDEFAGDNIKARVSELGLGRSIRQFPRFLSRWVASRKGSLAGKPEQERSDLISRDRHMRQILNGADLILSPSRFLRNEFIRWGVPSDRILYFPNGVPNDLAPLPQNATRSSLCFGYTGGFHPYKGLHILIQAFNQLTDQDVTLRIWGFASSPKAQEYERQLKAMVQNPRIEFVGAYEPSQLGAVLSEIDMLILPSIWYENCPMSILEALAFGVPVITSNIGGMAELVPHQVNGLQFDVGNASELAASIRQVAEQPDLIEHFRRNIQAPPTAQQAGLSLQSLYRQIIQSNSESD